MSTFGDQSAILSQHNPFHHLAYLAFDEKRLLATLLSLCGRDHCCDLTREQLQAQTGLNRHSVKQAARRLEAKRLIEVLPTRGVPNTYLLTLGVSR